MGPGNLHLPLESSLYRPLLPLPELIAAALCRRLLFGVLLVVIMAISVHDAALVVINHAVIGDVEQNPIGRWLLRVNDGQVWLFVGAKLLGTAAAAAVLIEALRLAPRVAWIAVSAVTAMQISLLAYLSLV